MPMRAMAMMMFCMLMMRLILAVAFRMLLPIIMMV